MLYRAVVTLVTLSLTIGSAIAVSEVIAAASSPQAPQRLAQLQKTRLQKSSKESWLRDLNLTPNQLRKIREIRNQYRDRLNQQRGAVLQAQRELKALMATNASAEQIRQKFDQVQVLKQALNDTRMESMIAIRGVLNPEQRQKLNAVLQQYSKSRNRDRAQF